MSEILGVRVPKTIWMRRLTVKDVSGEVVTLELYPDDTLVSTAETLEVVALAPKDCPHNNSQVFIKQNCISLKVINYAMEVFEGPAIPTEPITQQPSPYSFELK